MTFRWIKQHVAACSFLETGVACCLPTCAKGSSVAVTEFVENGAVWVFWVHLGIPVRRGLMCTGLRLRRRAYRWTRPLGGGRREPCLRGLSGVHRITRTCACWECKCQCSMYCCLMLPYVPALVRLPSLHGYLACMVKHGKTFFSPSWVFLLTIPPKIISNDFGGFGNKLADSNSIFVVADFFNDSNFWCVQSSTTCNETVHVHVPWPHDDMCTYKYS